MELVTAYAVIPAGLSGAAEEIVSERIRSLSRKRGVSAVTVAESVDGKDGAIRNLLSLVRKSDMLWVFGREAGNPAESETACAAYAHVPIERFPLPGA